MGVWLELVPSSCLQWSGERSEMEKPSVASSGSRVSFSWQITQEARYGLWTKFVEIFYIRHSGKHFVSPGSHPEIRQSSPPKTQLATKEGILLLKTDLEDEWAEGWGRGCVDGQRETHTCLTEYFGWKSSSWQWSMKQSVYCEVGLIPGEEEKWFLIDWKEINSFLPFAEKVLDKYLLINFLHWKGLNASNSV